MPEENLTELGAVNQMLLTIGEQKVNALESTGVLEVDVARTTLAEVSRDVQGEGWHFNTEHGVRLPVDADGSIPVPTNCLRVWRPPRSSPAIIQRGTRLYNLSAHSYVFRGPLTVSIQYFLPFDDLIPSARHYIALRASRRFQERISRSEITEQFVLREETMARAQLEAADAADAGYNVILDNRPTFDAAMRDRR